MYGHNKQKHTASLKSATLVLTSTLRYVRIQRDTGDIACGWQAEEMEAARCITHTKKKHPIKKRPHDIFLVGPASFYDTF